MRVITRLTGTSPLLQHNIQLADPDNPWAKQIAAITGKRKKTEEDRQEISRLEFQGSLYYEDGRVVVPMANIRKCFQETAKTTKRGRDINRAVHHVGDLDVPLLYDGPQDVAGLLADPTFRDVTLVGVSGKRVVRTRPKFNRWTIEAEWELVTTIMDFDDFVAIVASAGLVEGLGDGRTQGRGKFIGEVKAL